MSDTAETTLVATAAERPPFYRDATVVKWLVQVATLVLIIFALLFLAGQAGDNLEAKDIKTGFGFLEVDPGIDLSEGIDTQPDTGGRALWVGMVNTIRLAIGGIVVATILGIIVGVGRLSHNWIVNKLASAFIEYMRNIPLLVHIIVLFVVIGGTFGQLTADVGPINGWIHASNKGVSVPRVFISDGFYQWLVFLLIGGDHRLLRAQEPTTRPRRNGPRDLPGRSRFGASSRCSAWSAGSPTRSSAGSAASSTPSPT